MTPFDEDEERRRWEAMGMSPALGAGQAAATDVTQEALRWLGSGGAANQNAAAPAMQMPSIPEPPEMQANHAGIIAAAIADLALNKGRSMGTLIGHMATSGDQVAKENWMRKRQHALDTATIADRMRGPAGADPEVLRLREESLRLREMGLAQGGQRLELDKTKHVDRQENREEDQRLWNERYGVGGVREQVAMNREGRAAGEWNRRTDISEENKIGSEERALGRELAKEGRESERNAAQAAIPGWRTKQGLAPNKDNAKQAREIADSLGELDYFAGKLKETHANLNGLQAKMGANFNAFLGSDEAAQMLVDADIYHQQLLAAGRKLQNMGVPQLYELQMLEKAMPRLDSLTGILNAGRAYSTVSREAQLQAQRRMGVFGYEPDTGQRAPTVQGGGGGGLGSVPVPSIDAAKRYQQFGWVPQ